MPTLETQILDEVIAGSRRKMLTLGGAALASLAFPSLADAQTATLVDADYLNFALNLEYLEAQYYTLAVSGMTIDQMGISIKGGQSAGAAVTVKPGGPTACKVPFTTSIPDVLVSQYATETALEERNHVAFLSGALGGSAVAQPAIDLYNSFNALASLLGLGLTSFDPFASSINFLIGSYIFEDVGVTAYTGAAAALTVSGNLNAAAGIQAVEAYHAGMVRTTIWGIDQNPTTLGPAGTARAICSAISNLRASVDGSNSITAANPQGDDIGLAGQMVALGGTSAIYPASSIIDASTTGSLNPAGASSGTANSTVFARTAAQVLKIVYAGGTTTSNMGFFRAGLNGTVK